MTHEVVGTSRTNHLGWQSQDRFIDISGKLHHGVAHHEIRATPMDIRFPLQRQSALPQVGGKESFTWRIHTPILPVRMTADDEVAPIDECRDCHGPLVPSPCAVIVRQCRDLVTYDLIREGCRSHLRVPADPPFGTFGGMYRAQERGHDY